MLEFLILMRKMQILFGHKIMVLWGIQNGVLSGVWLWMQQLSHGKFYVVKILTEPFIVTI